MTWPEFWVVLIACGVTMLACRVLPLFILKGRELPHAEACARIHPARRVRRVGRQRPVRTGMFDAGLWPAAIPLVAALCVVVVAAKTKSLLWCAVTGVAAYALLSLI